MIRLVFALRRSPSLTREDFQAYWKNTHAPLVAELSKDLDILRYVQTHTVDEAKEARKARGEMEPPYDGVAELWWSDETKLEEIFGTNAGQLAGKLLLEDEARFIDLANSPIWFAHEYPQINPSPEEILAEPDNGIIKVFFPLRQKSLLAESEARHYWLTHHGPIVRAKGNEAGILCYRQIHHANSKIDIMLQKSRGTRVSSYLGHAEAWVDRNGITSAEAAEAANKAFISDEMNFIDMKRSTIFYGNEYSVIDNR